MKTLSRLLICFLFLPLGKATAQETFAPLLTENTILFVHVDFGKVDIDSLKAEATKASESLLQNLGFDARSQRATLRDLDVELEKLDDMIRPVWETVTKEFGIQEVALIVDAGLLEQNVPAVLAFSWEGKTENDSKKLISRLLDTLYPVLETFESENRRIDSRSKAEENSQAAFFPVGDFLLMVLTDDFMFDPASRRQIRQIIADWVKAAAADDKSPVLPALQSLNKSDEVKAVLVWSNLMKNSDFRTEFELDSLPPDTPAEVKNLILALENIDWLAASFLVAEYFAGTVEDNRRLMTYKMRTAADAQQLRELMLEAVDAMAKHEELAMFPPLAFEFYKGWVRTWFPDVEGDTLIFRMKHLRRYTWSWSL